MNKHERELRRSIVEACRAMNSLGINQGTSGNISIRHGEVMLITPTGVPYDELKPEDIAEMPLEGEYGSWRGPLQPSSEWRFHLDIMRARPEVGAIVHTHSVHATSLAMAGKEIPACHYMVAAAGGPNIRVADYATFGTPELSRNALKALEGRTCCLLGNHGVIATGANLKRAMWLAVEVETIARQYVVTLALGGPKLLSDDEIAHVVEKFKGYGLRPKGEAALAPRRPAAKKRGVRKAAARKPAARKIAGRR
jgi:L-fuculose-phosphate aldolase